MGEAAPLLVPVSEDRREYEDAQFWFRDGVHWPGVVAPWDATIYEYALTSLSQYNTRHWDSLYEAWLVKIRDHCPKKSLRPAERFRSGEDWPFPRAVTNILRWLARALRPGRG